MSVTKAVHVDVRLVWARGNADRDYLAVTGRGDASGHNNAIETTWEVVLRTWR